MHSRCDKSSFPIGEFESPCPISLYFLEVGPSRNCVKEANLPLGPTVEGNQPAGRLLGSKELGQSNHVREEMAHLNVKIFLRWMGFQTWLRSKLGLWRALCHWRKEMKIDKVWCIFIPNFSREGSRNSAIYISLKLSKWSYRNCASI